MLFRSTENWDQIRNLFEAALGRPPDERPAFVSSLDCGDEVRDQVHLLLLTHDEVTDFLEQPAILKAGLSALDEQPEQMVERRLGPYQLLREIGRGGMATVYLAVRVDDESQRQVALKLVWPGLNGGEVIRRFRQEQEILSKLDHPNIARLFDSGSTEVAQDPV